MKISYANNIFNNILTHFQRFYITASFSEILCHVEASHLKLNEKQLTGFSMMKAFTERCLRVDFHFSLNVNVDVSVVSYMKYNSCEMKLHDFLQQWINSIIFRTIKPKSTSKATLFETNSLILLSFIFFFCVL